MKCEICGSNSIKKESDSTFVCQDCGMQYDISMVRNLLQDQVDNSTKNNDSDKTIEFVNIAFNNLSSYDELHRDDYTRENDILGNIDRQYKMKIKECVRSGGISEKVKAIGLYREASGLGLADAKEIIDKYYDSILK